MGCAQAQTKLPAANGVLCATEFSLREKRCCPAGKLHWCNAGNEGKQADFRGNYASKSAIMHKIAKTAKNRILRCFCSRQFWGKNGGKNRKNRLTGVSIHHANKGPPHKHEKTHPCIQNAQKCPFRLIFGHFAADLCTQKHPFSPTANYRNSL